MSALDDHLGYHVRVISAHFEPRVFSNHGVPLLLAHHINVRLSRHLGERLANILQALDIDVFNLSGLPYAWARDNFVIAVSVVLCIDRLVCVDVVAGSGVVPGGVLA